MARNFFAHAPLVALLVIVVLTLPVSATEYRIVDLGVGRAFGINDSGQAVGDSGNHAALWQDGGMTDLGALPGDAVSHANRINNSGQIAGYSGFDTTSIPFFPAHAVVWQNGVMNYVEYGQATDINSQGEVAGSSAGFYSYSGWVMKGGVVTPVSKRNGISGQCSAINNCGQIVGCESELNHTDEAYLWQGTSELRLGALNGSGKSLATDINDQGQVVGYSESSSQFEEDHAFLWHDGIMQDLGSPGGIFGTSYAWAINEKGQIVGNWGRDASGPKPSYACVWEGGGMQNLGTLPGFLYSCAEDINQNGVIAGWVEDPNNGIYHAVLWEPVPEPGGIAPLVCVILLLVGRSKWRRASVKH